MKSMDDKKKVFVSIGSVKVSTPKNGFPSMHISRDIIVDNLEVDCYSSVIGQDSDSPCILAGDFLLSVFKELSTLAAKDFSSQLKDREHLRTLEALKNDAYFRVF